MEMILIIFVIIAFLLFTIAEFTAFCTLILTGLYVIVKTLFFDDKNKSDKNA